MMKEKEKPLFISGNEAVVMGALRAGLKFFAGYPITPSSEILETLSYLLPERGGVCIQLEDEIASIAAIIGASLAGSKSMTATSGPGFSLMQENIGFAAMAEVPCVIVDVQRGGPSTGLPTFMSQGDIMQSRWGTHGDHSIIVVAPTTVTETYTLTVYAFNMAEKYRTPVVILLDETLGHGSEKVIVPDIPDSEIISRKIPKEPPEEYLPYHADESLVPEFVPFGWGYRYHVTGLSHDETGFPNIAPDVTEKLHRRLVEKVEKHKHDIIKYRDIGDKDAKICFVAIGTIARSAIRAHKILSEKGVKTRVLIPQVVWPFFDEVIFEAAQNVEYFVVPEMNYGQLAFLVERAVQGKSKVVKINRLNGYPILPKEIVNKTLEVTGNV